MKKPPVPLFVLGSGRSGTTITSALLNRLSGIHIAKETGYIGSCLPLLRSIHEPQCLQQLISGVNSWLETEQWEQRASEDGYRQFCARYGVTGGAGFLHYVWQLESPVGWDELEYIGDNTPLYVMSIPGILELLPNARFIHVVRDPRDVVCSMVKMKFGAEDRVAAAARMASDDRLLADERKAAGIILSNRDPLRGSMHVPLKKRWGNLPVFWAAAQEAASALQAHVKDSVEDQARRTGVATLPHHRRLAEPLSPGRVGRFRSELSARQVQQIEEIAQYGMLAYGYQPTQWHISPLIRNGRLFRLRTVLRDIALKCLKRLRK